MKGLVNKVKNLPTRQRFVVSTVRKGEDLFETAVFTTTLIFYAFTFLYDILRRFGVKTVPETLSEPDMTVESHTRDEAWETHYRITARLTTDYPSRLFQEFTHD